MTASKRGPPSGVAVEGCFDLVDGVGNEVVDSGDRFRAHPGGGEVADKDLEDDGDEGAAGASTGGGSAGGPAVRGDGEAGWEEWDVGWVFPTHGYVDGRQVDRAVDNQGA